MNKLKYIVIFIDCLVWWCSVIFLSVNLLFISLLNYSFYLRIAIISFVLSSLILFIPCFRELVDEEYAINKNLPDIDKYVTVGYIESEVESEII